MSLSNISHRMPKNFIFYSFKQKNGREQKYLVLPIYFIKHTSILELIPLHTKHPKLLCIGDKCL
jgi:hypothetical protein